MEKLLKVFITRGCKRFFLAKGAKNLLCTGAAWDSTGAKHVSDGAKDAGETFAPWVQKTFCSLGLLLTSFRKFPILGPLSQALWKFGLQHMRSS